MSDDAKNNAAGGAGYDLGSMFASVRGETSVTRINWNDIEPREQSRVDFKDIEELANSIVQVGQIQPIIVKPAPNGKYYIRSGERRWRACKLLDRPVDAIVRTDQENEALELASELVENLQRDNLTPMETARALHRLKEQGLEQQKIAEMLGMSKQFVSLHMAIMALPESVLELHDEEITRDADTLNTLRKLHAINPELAEEACRKALLHGISRAQAKALLKEAKQPEKAGKGTPADADWQGMPKEATGAPAGAEDSQATAPESQNSNQAAPWNDDGASERGEERKELSEEQPTEKGSGHSEEEQSGKPEQTAPQKEQAPVQPPQSKSTDPAPLRGDGWTLVSRGGIKITVTFPMNGEEGEHRWGVMMTERVDDDKEYVWVKAVGESGEEEHRILAEEITIMSAEALADA
jgi:ParB family chromosome partitioning protein